MICLKRDKVEMPVNLMAPSKVNNLLLKQHRSTVVLLIVIHMRKYLIEVVQCYG